MVLLREYRSLEDCLVHLKIQVSESINYVKQKFPAFDEPEELFNWLRSRVIYITDPNEVELLMTVHTFVSGSRTGKPWAGDCDDFTIVSLAALIANGFTPYVILVGRKAAYPVHIYAGVEDSGIVPFDLTNKDYGIERTNYKYQQILPFTV